MPNIIRPCKIYQHAGSLAIVLPVEICRSLGFKRGDYLDLLVADTDTIIARRIKVVVSDKLEARKDGELPKINYGK